MLEASVRKYQNRAIETAQVIEELIQLAREMRDAGRRGEELGLSEDEVAFYDTLETHDSAVQVLGDETESRSDRRRFDSFRESARYGRWAGTQCTGSPEKLGRLNGFPVGDLVIHD